MLTQSTPCSLALLLSFISWSCSWRVPARRRDCWWARTRTHRPGVSLACRAYVRGRVSGTEPVLGRCRLAQPSVARRVASSPTGVANVMATPPSGAQTVLAGGGSTRVGSMRSRFAGGSSPVVGVVSMAGRTAEGVDPSATIDLDG